MTAFDRERFEETVDDEKPIACRRCHAVTSLDDLNDGICAWCGESPALCRGCGQKFKLRDLSDEMRCIGCEP